jgi:hypothetical protein
MFGRIHVVCLPRIVMFCALTTDPTYEGCGTNKGGTFTVCARVLSGVFLDFCPFDVV